MKRETLIEAVNERVAQIASALAPLDDEIALELTTLFPVWAAGVEYTVDKRIQYEDKLYKVVQAHTSQEGWEPPNVPSLFAEVAKPGEIPVWKQPTGAQDAYMTGDKVHYPTADDPVYVSDVDNNTWAPGVYGWSLVE